MALRKLSPGGIEYLTGAVACADRGLGPGESLADYHVANGYSPGEWFGQGAQSLEVIGWVSQGQMTALFGEGRHPNADMIEARLIDQRASLKEVDAASKLGRPFGGKSPVAGYEMVFAPPKSVSVA